MEYYNEYREIHIYIAMLLVPLVPISIIPNLKIMAIVSCFGIFSTAICCILIMIATITTMDDQAMDSTILQTRIDTPLYLLVALSTLQPVAQLMCIESQMKNRKNFLGYFGVMNRALIIVTFSYLLLSSVVYVKFTNGVHTNILNNLPKGKIEIAACAVFILQVVFTYPINIYTVYDFAWEVYIRSRLHGYPEVEKVLWGYAVRISVAIFTIVIAAVLVKVVTTKYFVMAVCLPLVILIFPPMIELNMGHKLEEFGPRRYKFWLDILVIFFGIATLVLSLRAFIILYHEL